MASAYKPNKLLQFYSHLSSVSLVYPTGPQVQSPSLARLTPTSDVEHQSYGIRAFLYMAGSPASTRRHLSKLSLY